MSVAPYAHLRKEVPSACALSIDEVHMFWLLACTIKTDPDHVLTYAWFQSVFNLTLSQARTRVATLQRTGLIEATLVGTPTRPLGQRYAVTPLGMTLSTQVAPLFTTQSTAAKPTHAPVATKRPSAPINLLDQASQKTLATIARQPGHAPAMLNAAMRRGEHPDYAALKNEGVLDDLIREIHAYIDKRLMPRADDAPSTDDPSVTRVPAATADQVRSAATAGVTVPSVAAKSPNASGIAATASLLFAEAAVRHPRLVASGMLAARLPEILWAILNGRMADYGPPLLRVRCALKWLATGTWMRPNGYDQETGRGLMLQLDLTPANC